MTVFKSEGKLLYFAHIPKCGGSSVEKYLENRFGCIGFFDDRFFSAPISSHWSRTSPQHIDWASLQSLLPAALLDTVFTVVRHPVSRIVSAYHFQAEVYRAGARDVTFSEWLREQAQAFEGDPFILDNHFRPQVDFVPADCTVFHLEHGLDALVPYIDRLVGNQNGARFVGHANRRGGGKASGVSVAPTAADIALIEQIYAADFARFGYAANRKLPAAPKPALAPDFLAASALERARMDNPLNRIASRVRRKIGI